MTVMIKPKVPDPRLLRILEDMDGNLGFFFQKDQIKHPSGLQLAMDILQVGRRELAKICEVSPETVYQWMAPKSIRRPSRTALTKLRAKLLRARIGESYVN